MSYKAQARRFSFNLNRKIGWRMAVSLTFGLLLVAGMQDSRAAASLKFVSEPAQDKTAIKARRKFEEGEALRNQGTVESLRLALKKYEEALLLCRAIGERRAEAIMLSSIGSAYHSLGEKRKALDFYMQALMLDRAIGARNEEATTLHNIGFVYNTLGDKQKALDFYSQAAPILRAVGNRYGEAMTLDKIGSVYDTLGEKQKALDFYHQALPFWRAVGDRSGE
jgi:tetratricopeptide (TPR) repeat protein